MNIEFPEGPPGIHPPTAAIHKLLRGKQIQNPISGSAFSEAFLLGIGGGLDIGVILFQFNHLPNPMLVLGFRNQWNNAQSFLEKITDRLRLPATFKEYDSGKTAQKDLQDTLKADGPAIVLVDKAYLTYQKVPESQRGYTNHTVTVYGRDGRLWRLYVDDLAEGLWDIREKTFTAARASLSQNNFLVATVDGDADLTVRELRQAITESIRDCAAQLTQPIRRLGISTLENWAQSLTDRTDHQGWAQVFKGQKGLYPALRTIYESIRLDGTEGSALRKTYSDFLHEAASYLGNPALNAVAGQYLQISNHWINLAESALPSTVPDFDTTKGLLSQRYEAYRKNDAKGMQKSLKSLQTLENRINKTFPLDDAETSELFERLASQVKLIAELETSAALRLRDVVRR
ncbi:BtrH N-terminal domain-containing protein [bacterium]|nr:BtrH N-terminal domain-containing protein [bacterium]